MQQLGRHTPLPAEALVGAAAPAATGLVHLGLGAFHRAHAAVFTARAIAHEEGPWGIHAFANRSADVVRPLQAQDHRYAVLELSARGERAGVVDVHRASGIAAQDPAAVVAAVARPEHRVLTLTVSEAGYCLSSATGGLDVDAPQVRADLADPRSPRTAVGLLARGLEARAASGEPFAVLSCDNLQSAGRVTRRAVTELLEAGGADDDVLDYVRDRVAFPNAMVDRIVPATTPGTAASVARLLGVDDGCPVRAEEFSMWVMEDHFPGGRPAWDLAGAVMSDEVEAYELVKLRLLNGSHSLISYLGALDGRETIPEAFAQDFVDDAVTALVQDDYLPGIRLPRGLDAEAYVASLRDRWSNVALGDRTARVGSDGSTKLLQRVPEPAVQALEAGRMPHRLALVVAAWICCVAPPAGFDPGPVAAAMVEPARDRLAEATRGARSVPEHVAAIVGAHVLPDSLTRHQAYVDRVADLVGVVVRHGARAAATEAARS